MLTVPESATAIPRLQGRSGITLLEVLVSCGILVVGLASLASILPAAGSRLAQAAVEDRVGTAAANAYAEIFARRLASSDLFANASKACVFGYGFDHVNTEPESLSLSQANPRVLYGRIDATRGFVLEDDIASTLGRTTSSASGGPQEYRPDVCWGAMLSPPAGISSASGIQATLNIAIFTKQGDRRLLTLTGTADDGKKPAIFRYRTGDDTGATDEQIRRQYLAGCSYVLALPKSDLSPPPRPRWLRISSSWTTPGPGLLVEDSSKRQSFVVLEGVPEDSTFTDGFVTRDMSTNSVSITVIAYQFLARVDEHVVSLD